MSAETGTIDREQLLNEVLAAYLKGVQHGEAPTRQELLNQYPELARELTAFFDDRDYVDDLAAPLRQALADGPVLTPGMVLDNYDLLEEIGQGGMGLIFKARQRSLNRIVALKMLRLGPWATPDDLQRFRTEADAVANLDHPHVVPIYEVGAFHGQPYFTMKLMEGGSLAHAADRVPWAAGGRGGRRRTAEVVATVARAVHYAHQRGILHRDLKPANILLDANGKPHVTDFGLAKRLRVRPATESPVESSNGSAGPAVPSTADAGEGADGGPTQAGSILGTPSYMAPEQATGQKGMVTTAVDVYGLGAILYELLTGRPPFRGATPLETLHQLLHQEPPRPRGLRPEIERDLETIALKCLEKDPRRRYASALALAEDLERFLAGMPIQARPVGPAERLWRWCRRQPALAAVSGLAVVAVAAVVAGSVLFAFTAARHAEELRHQQSQTQQALDEARRQQALAEESFRQAHQAVNDFCVKVSQRLEAVPSFQPLRKELLEAALQYYQTFITRREQDPKLRRELAETYQHVGEINGGGVLPRALEAFEKSLALYQELLRAHPDDVGLQEEMARVRHGIAIHTPAGEESLKLHRENLELLEPLLRDHPDSLRLREAQTANYNSLAVVYRRMGHLDDAAHCFERACDLQEQLANQYPKKPHARKNLAVYVNNLGIFQNELGRTNAALQSFQRALAIRRRLVEADPQNEKYQLDVAASSRDIGMVQNNTGRPKEALAAFEQARAIRERLARANPKVTFFRDSLAYSYRDVGQALQKLERLDEARKAFERSRALQEELVKADPTAAWYQYQLAHCHFLVGDIHRAQRHWDEAIQAFRKAQSILEALIGKHTHELDYAYLLGLTLDGLGMTLKEIGRPEEAATVLTQALAHQKTAYGKAPRVRHYRKALDKQYRHLAEMHRAAGRAAAAVAVTLERRPLWKGHGAELVDVAGDLARAAQVIGRDGAALTAEQQAERDRYLDLALETLRQAVAGGYKDGAALQRDSAFEPLRGRADFQELVRGIRP